MSQLIGQYGSVLPDTYVQPMSATGPNSQPPLATAYGNYLGGGTPSLGADDPTRQRPTSYVLPRQIELMNGFFTQDFYGTEKAGSEPVSYSMAYTKAPHQVTSSLRATAMSSGQPVVSPNTGVYGLSYTTMKATACADKAGCSVTNSGSCRCGDATSFFLSEQT